MLNEHSPLYAELKPVMDGMYSPSLGRADAMTLLYNSADLPQRLRAIAHNAQVRRAQQQALCRRLSCFGEQTRFFFGAAEPSLLSSGKARRTPFRSDLQFEPEMRADKP